MKKKQEHGKDFCGELNCHGEMCKGKVLKNEIIAHQQSTYVNAFLGLDRIQPFISHLTDQDKTQTITTMVDLKDMGMTNEALQFKSSLDAIATALVISNPSRFVPEIMTFRLDNVFERVKDRRDIIDVSNVEKQLRELRNEIEALGEEKEFSFSSPEEEDRFPSSVLADGNIVKPEYISSLDLCAISKRSFKGPQASVFSNPVEKALKQNPIDKQKLLMMKKKYLLRIDRALRKIQSFSTISNT